MQTPQMRPNTSAREQSEGQELDTPNWIETVDRIRAGNPEGLTELYGIFTSGIRFLLMRTLGVDDVDDRVHDCFLIVAEAIRAGELREPAALMGYVSGVVRRRIAKQIGEAVADRRAALPFDDSAVSMSDRRHNAEQALIARQRVEIARRALQGLSARNREILRRYYLLEQPQEQICNEMGLSYSQFRLLKSRAKARFGLLGQNLAENRSIGMSDTGAPKAKTRSAAAAA
jgi:RNA polymerase sigma-70 factor (ECF subfamily)